jgi:hypothetical protein
MVQRSLRSRLAVNRFVGGSAALTILQAILTTAERANGQVAPPAPLAPVAAPASPIPPHGFDPKQSGDSIHQELRIDRGPFDSRRAFYGIAGSVSRLTWRRAVAGAANTGYELKIGQTITHRPRWLYLTGRNDIVLRAFDSKSFEWTLASPSVEVGLSVPLLEVGAGVSVTLFTVDVFRGDWSVQALSPRVHADATLRLGQWKVLAQAYSEYKWRWFGPDYRVQGLSIGIGWEVPPRIR